MGVAVGKRNLLPQRGAKITVASTDEKIFRVNAFILRRFIDKARSFEGFAFEIASCVQNPGRWSRHRSHEAFGVRSVYRRFSSGASVACESQSGAEAHAVQTLARDSEVSCWSRVGSYRCRRFRAGLPQSYALPPLPVMARGVDDCHDRDQIAVHAVDNPIRKPWRQKPADVSAALADAVNQGIGGQGVDGIPNDAGEISPQSSAAVPRTRPRRPRYRRARPGECRADSSLAEAGLESRFSLRPGN